MRVKLCLSLLLVVLTTMLAIVACGASSGSGDADKSDARSDGPQANTEQTGKAEADAAAVVAGYIPSSQMGEKVGEEGTVRGRIADYLYVTGKPRKPTLLLFDVAAGFSAGSLVSDIKTPDTPSILVWREDKKNFRTDFYRFFTGKTVCVTGKIELFDNKPVIIATNESQIQVDC